MNEGGVSELDRKVRGFSSERASERSPARERWVRRQSRTSEIAEVPNAHGLGYVLTLLRSSYHGPPTSSLL